MMLPTKYDKPLRGLDWLQYYGKSNVYHPGVDFNFGKGWDDYGQDVYAPRSGHVEYVSAYPTWSNRYNGGFGQFVILIHADGTYTRYAHLKSVADGLKVSKEIKKGDLIGFLGNTGTTSPHLHFEVFNKDMAEIQAKHWRKWGFYPTGKTKQWIVDYYLNPWEWLASDVEGIPAWAMEGWIEAVRDGVAPKDPFKESSVKEIEQIMKDVGIFNTTTGKIPAYRLMELRRRLKNLAN